MTQALLQMMATGSPVVPIYVDDVFSAYTYTGNGSTQTITNGIDLAGKGGLVWIKSRSAATDHQLFDTARTATYELISNLVSAQVADADTLTALGSTGFSLGADATVNTNAATYVSWTFRKAPKFFDIYSGTTDGSGNASVTHSLGSTPGMVIFKSTAGVGNWMVYHRSTGSGQYLNLNDTNAAGSAGGIFYNISSTTISCQNPWALPNSGFVAYLFAHDTSADGLIQCGSFTTDGSGGATVNHGWSAGVQFAFVKCSSTTGDWEMYDTARTSGWSGSDARLRANLSNAEDSVTRLSASGTSVTFAGLSNSATYIYMFIKAP